MDRGELHHVELTIAAQPAFLHLVRLTAGFVAARANLDLNDVEDLRLAADELCLVLMGPTGTAGRLLLHYQWGEASVEISCTLQPAGPADESGQVESGADDQLNEDPADGESPYRQLSEQILDALVDGHGKTERGGLAHAWLRMRRPGPEVE
jgi:hypothetical protein